MKKVKFLSLLAVLFLGLSVASCGGDEPDGKKGVAAYTGAKYIDGTSVSFYLATNSETDRCHLILFFAGEYSESTFYADLSEQDVTVSAHVDGSTVKLRRESESKIVIMDTDYTVDLYSVDGDSYWQQDYDEALEGCINYYNEYLYESVRMPELSLWIAKGCQETMVRIHRWAEEDGSHIVVSEWETKVL